MMFLHKQNRKFHKGQNGFTLVELIVVITVMAIVLSLTALGILAWMDWSAFQKENEYAQTLFIAAQNQLSEYASNGRLEEMMDSLAGGSYEKAAQDESRTQIFCQDAKYGLNLTGKIDKLVDSQGNAYDLKTIFPESVGKTGDKAKLYQDEIVSLRAEAGDYENYLANPKKFKQDDPEAFWVFELLGAYVYDTTILNGTKSGGSSADGASICVELTPHSGQVFSVLYTDKANQFIYMGLSDGKGSDESAGVLNISDRREEYRRERMIGYYGVDSLYAVTENKMVRPGFSYVKLINKDTFYLEAKLAPKSRSLIGRMQYEIDLDASKDSNDKKLTIELDGTKLKNAAATTAPIKCPVYRYKYVVDPSTGKNTLTKFELGSFPIMAWMEEGAVLHVMYDAADIQATTYRYESELDTLRSDVKDTASTASFSDTYSFFRFGVDADDVYATIRGRADGYAETKPISNFGNINPAKNQTGKNPCFASFRAEKKDDKTAFKYTLINERHLYNVRYIEDISYAKEAGGYPNTSQIAGVSFVMKSDLDFAKFQAEGNLYSSDVRDGKVDLTNVQGKIYTIKNAPIDAVTRFNCEFPTFKQLRKNDVFDGGNKKLKGILSSELSNVVYMIYYKPENNPTSLTLPEQKPIGLFNVNYGTIKDLSLDDFSIKGSDMAGAFCGANAGNVEKLTTLNTNNVSRVSGVKNIGGIMGFQIVSDDTCTIKELTNRAGVYGTESVGGIAGMVRNEFSNFDFTAFDFTAAQLNSLKSVFQKTVQVQKCTNYGPVYGYAQKDLKGVYVQGGSAAPGAMPDDDPEKIRYIGGIVGYCYNADETDTAKMLITDCISSPEYSGEDLKVILASEDKLREKLKGDYVGGIAGYNYYGTIQNCSAKAEKGKNGCLFGYRYVGGIVGLNIGPSSGIIGGTLSAKGVNENHVVGCSYVGGITGANASVKDETEAYDKKSVIKSKDPEILSAADAILQPVSARSLGVKLENWTNKGVVIATEKYAGGITGYNAGWVYRCHSEMAAASVDDYFNILMKNCDLGDYCGGIAGYNNGIIGNTDRVVSEDKKTSTKAYSGTKISASVYVNGHNYVGGIVGYNDVDSIVEDYQISGGYIRGYDHNHKDQRKSSYVGGYAGLNASVDLLMDLEDKKAREVYSNPNEVKGSYFVGGCIGGNMINTHGMEKTTTVPSTGGMEDWIQAADRVDVDHAYATAAIDRNPWPDGNGIYTYQFNFTIYNKFDETISSWQIPFGENKALSWYIKESWNMYYDKKQCSIYPIAQYNTCINPNGTVSLGMHISSNSLADLDKLADSVNTSAPIPIRYFLDSDNKPGSYWGISPDSHYCTIENFKSKPDSNWNFTENWVEYSFNIRNNHPEMAMTNWRVEIDIPEEAHVTSVTGGWLGTAAFENGVASLTASGDNRYHYSINSEALSSDMSLKIYFDTKEDRDRFSITEDDLRITFNNVVYHGGRPDGSTTTPGGTQTVVVPDDFYTDLKTDNFLGTLEAEEFAGGFIGYNLMFDADKEETWIKDDEDADYGAVYIIQRKITDAFKNLDASPSDAHQKLIDKKEFLDDLNAGLQIPLQKSKSTMYIQGKDKAQTTSTLGSITGKIFVGGVMGYNDGNTSLYIKDVENASQVIATEAVENLHEQIEEVDSLGNPVYRKTDYLRNEKLDYSYSYAGGIIGKVSTNMVVDHCWNTFSGTVSTKGTYTGGLCEINEGLVKNCEVSGFGSGVDDYMGGLCGLNKTSGTIQECNYTNKTVSGRNVVGGIAAENFGVIRQIKMKNPKIRASALTSGTKDGVVGLLAGFNGATGVIELEGDIQNIQVKSDGRYVGAVSGVNEGVISNLKTTENKIDNNLAISGTIEGYYDVGALVGLNRDPNKDHAVANYTNKATIIALNGNAGGIVGENASANVIKYCVNDAVVSATVGNAGGIVSVNNGEISNCYGYKTVTAPKGMCGGITAINGDKKHKDAVIKECYVGPESEGGVLSGKKDVTFVSTQSVGGVTAINYGIIEDNTLNHVIATNIGTIMHTSIGVVAGENAAGGRIYLKGNTQSVIGSQSIAKTNNCNVGGIAGVNDGLITNRKSYEAGTETADGYAWIGAEVKLAGASYSSLGGVAGLNTGTIAYCQVDTEISGLLGTEKTGYGGIAGYNGYSTGKEYEKAKTVDHAGNGTNEGDNYRARIIGCTFDGNIAAPGSAGNPANIGGITGANGYGGYIEDCALGVRDRDFNGAEELTTNITSGDLTKQTLIDSNKKTDTKSYAYIGGVTGRNYAQIRNVDMEPKAKDTDINVISYAGSIGGMVGYEYEGASITGESEVKRVSTPRSMNVEMRSGENDYGVGGLIGYCKSGEPFSYIKNYAHVKNEVYLNVKTGGLIGTIEQQKVGCVEFTNCDNYGKIEGRLQIGGLIGRSKFCAVRMTNCNNYGEIYASGGKGYAGGLMACIYEIRSVDCFFTGCSNHGYVHTADNNTNYAGGLIGGVAGNSEKASLYFYDCDNTGIVEHNNQKSADSNVGSFIGTAMNTNQKLYFEQCQNYNISKSANGYIGTGNCIVKMKDCLDDSNQKTNLAAFSPFAGNSISKSNSAGGLSNSTFKNVYYLDETSRNVYTKKFVENEGAYFTLDRSTKFDFTLLGKNYPTYNNPALFLTEPSSRLLMRHVRNGGNNKLELHVAYDAGCTGLESFNIYLWNGDISKNTEALNGTWYFTARFTDINGKTETTTCEVANLSADWEQNKAVLTIPGTLNPKIKDIELSYTGSSELGYHGFSYTPKGKTQEAICTYIGKKNDTTFSLTAVKDNGNKKAVAPNKIVTHTINNFDDLLGLELYKTNSGANEFAYYTRTKSKILDFEFDVNNGENASGMDSFVFIVGSGDDTKDNTYRQYYADYRVTFTDINGNTATVSGLRANGNAAVGYHCTDERCMEGTRVKVPDTLDKKIRKIQLSITDLVYWYVAPGVDADTSTDPFDKNQSYFYFRGFRWIPQGSSEPEYMGVGPLKYKGFEDMETSGYISRLYCDYSQNANAPYVYTENDHNVGFHMTANDPAGAAYYGDLEIYDVSDKKPEGSGSRLRVYRDLHPKFVRMIQKKYAVPWKLDTPKPSVKEENGRFILTWPEVADAYSYEVKYEVKDEIGTVFEQSAIYEVGSGTTTFTVPISSKWKGRNIVFGVRAVNASRFTMNTTDYDSEWGYATAAVADVLAQPQVHAELTAGNKMVMILDNRDDYKLADGSYKDCVINVTYNGLSFTIPVASGYISREARYISGWNIGYDYNLSAVAKPNPDNSAVSGLYTTSVPYFKGGHLVENGQLTTNDQYVPTTLRGFYGDQADQMTYDMYFEVDNGRDCYVKSDIIAYDETIGEEVAYSTVLTHAASYEGKAYFTATLSDLPMEWFAEDFKSPIIAREYLHKSQYDIVLYGHTVAENVRLDGADAAENQQILASIKDPYYLSADDAHVLEENVSIWENGALKPGYTLQLKRDENGEKIYDIVYNATIELATKAAEAENAKQTGTARYKYYKHCVDYKMYTSDKQTIELIQAGSTELTTEKISADVIADDTIADDIQEYYMVRGVREKTQLRENYPAAYTAKDVQELQPAPIIDKAYREETVDGHKSYTFTFDEYFTDSYCLKNNTYYSSNAEDSMTIADSSVATTWAAFLEKSGYYEKTDTTVKRRLMNAYLYTYKNARYQVDLIGTTLAGEEAVISTQLIDAPEKFDTVKKSYTVGTKNVDTNYELYHHQVTFTDTDDIWNNYSNFTVRVMRLGELNSITVGTSVPNSTDNTNYPRQVKNADGAVFRLPRYSDYKIHVLMKLNTINNPSASLHKVDSSFVTDNLTYDISYGAITNSDQIKDLGGYLIKVEKTEESPGYDPNNKNTHYYYVKDYDKSVSGNDIALNVDALKSKGTVIEIDADKAYVKNGNTRTVYIDLSDYASGDVVSITVKAIASTKAENYTDGDEGTGTIVTIQERLATPDVSYLTVTHPPKTDPNDPNEPSVGMDDDSAAGDTYVNKNQYGEGMYLIYGSESTKDENYTNSKYEDVQMKMSAAIYDTAGNKDDISKVNEGDDTSGTWNEGSFTTLFTKAGEDKLLGKISQFTPQNIDLTEYEKYPGQFAGRWLKIALKATVNNLIDSQWTDQDAEDRATVNYKWIRIPKLQLDDVKLTETNSLPDIEGNYSEDAVVRYYYKKNSPGADLALYDDITDVSAASNPTALSFLTLSFDEDKCADRYDYMIIQTETKLDEEHAEDGYAVKNTDKMIPRYQLSLRRHLADENDANSFDGTWDVCLTDITLISTDNGTTWEASAVSNSEKLIGTIGSTLKEAGTPVENRAFQILQLPAIKTEQKTITHGVYNTFAELRYEPGLTCGSFRLVLPDITAIGDNPVAKEDNYETYFSTFKVLVTMHMEDEANENYRHGQAALWQRTRDEETVDGVTVIKYGTKIVLSMTDDAVTQWLGENISSVSGSSNSTPGKRSGSGNTTGSNDKTGTKSQNQNEKTVSQNGM